VVTRWCGVTCARRSNQNFALALDLRREDAVEGGDAVGGDDEEVAVVHLVDVAHLAAPREPEPGEGSLGDCSRAGHVGVQK